MPQGYQPSIWDKIKMGAVMGGTAGSVIGILFGTMAIYQYGAGPKGYMRTMGQYMMNSAVTFGLIMSIGSVVRTEGRSPELWRAQFAAAEARRR